MEGLLFKWTNYINGWQQRYFSLQDGILSYFASESDIDTGCKGALRVSACDVVVHPTDPCRFEILIPGEQRFFLKALNSTERQRWIVALGSCKAGVTNVEEVEKMQQAERSIEAKRSELRINRDLLVQQINGVCTALKAKSGENPEIIDAVTSLKATCDTLLSSADELIYLLLNSGRYRGAYSFNSVNGSPSNVRRPSILPQSLQKDRPTNSISTNSPNEISPRTTKLIEQIATTVVSSKPTNGSSSGLLNNHLRALRLSRHYPTFFSRMEFSFEDLALSQFTAASANNTSISAVEFLACCRSALTFFPSLASADGKSDNLSNLGSLQTVYAEVLADVVRLELAVKTLANVDDSTSAESARQRSLALSLADIVNAEIRAKQTRSSGSAYLALLWLSRSLNFAAEFLGLLYKDTRTASPATSSSNNLVEEVATEAYAKTLRDFHDWSVRGTATVILKAVPSSSRIQAVLLNVSSSENSVSMIPPMEALAQLQLDVERFVEALRRCLLCIHSFFSQRGLDPVFPPESKKQ